MCKALVLENQDGKAVPTLTRLARDLPAGVSAQAVTGIWLEQGEEAAEVITRGQVAGRTLIKR